jgi:hypothetical protein
MLSAKFLSRARRESTIPPTMAAAIPAISDPGQRVGGPALRDQPRLYETDVAALRRDRERPPKSGAGCDPYGTAIIVGKNTKERNVCCSVCWPREALLANEIAALKVPFPPCVYFFSLLYRATAFGSTTLIARSEGVVRRTGNIGTTLLWMRTREASSII